MTNPIFTTARKSLTQTEVAPATTHKLADGTLLLDFGRAAFGTLCVPNAGAQQHDPIVVHLSEKSTADGRVDRQPLGTVRYIRIAQEPTAHSATTRIVIPPDPRNTGVAAIRMPEAIGEVYPFRYAEIEGAAGLDASAVRQVVVHYPFDDAASSFQSSDPVLDTVWELCKYSIKATTFCGVYVDGDRERIPYEADAYINQLGHYCVDREYALARYTHEYLIQFPTWPSEWQMHSVLMAWADFQYTGETASLRAFYDDLCVKTLLDLARPDGLISTASASCTKAFEERLHLHHDRYLPNHGLRDLVDWPPGSFTQGGIGERDGHEMLPVNTVVNAFHYRALVCMARIAAVLGQPQDHHRFRAAAARVRQAINQVLFDPVAGVYIDGEGSQHASLHSNMFAAAFNLVPCARRPRVLAWIKSRGMACSVYGAQYLLEAMYLNDESDYALELLTARHDRGWYHMLQAGSTMTWEAWDHKYKNNLDWNHAWGAAPANIIPRFLMGVRPLDPGFTRALIQPRPGPLEHAALTTPSRLGPVTTRLENRPGQPFVLEIDIPEGMTARVDLPRQGRSDADVRVDGKVQTGTVWGRRVTLDTIPAGCHRLER